MALAKRGFNVDRCFIGESPGGVGQSLFSLHIDAMLGSNHGYFDPKVWYNEDELRKQIESFARCIVITGQVAPESHKKLHLDLFKKTMSADGIAGRKPYGYTTRMFNVNGWKRLEVNRMLVFAGITKSNFMSVMRRALAWKPKARFHSETVLSQAHADHELDGHFLADPILKAFLTSSAASAAGLRIQHAFELQHNQTDCVQIIEVQCLTLRTFVKIPSVPIKDFADVLGFDFFLSISLMSSAKVGIRVNLCFALITSAVFAIY